MDIKELTAKVSVNKNAGSVVLRAPKTWEYDVPYKVYLFGCSIANGYFNVDAAIEVAPDSFCEKSFSFKMEGYAKKYYDAFLDTAFPDQSVGLHTDDILGKAFVGKIVDNDGYDNLVAVSSCDDAIEPEEWMEADEENLPFL